MAFVMSLGIVGGSLAIAPAASADDKVTPSMWFDIAKKGDTATLKVTVFKDDAKPAPTGTVTFDYVSGQPTYTTDADGNLIAQITGWDYSVMGGSPGHFYAHYSGDANYEAASDETDFDPNGPSQWTVKWDLGAVSFPTQDLELEDGWDTVIPTTKELVDGWGFVLPANTEFNGVTIDGVHYAPGSTFVLTKDIVVKAEWKSTLPDPSSTNSSSSTAAPGDNSGSNAAGGAAGSNAAAKPASGDLAATGAPVSVGSVLALLLAGGALLAYRRKVHV